jgi:hypothetical protein
VAGLWPKAGSRRSGLSEEGAWNGAPSVVSAPGAPKRRNVGRWVAKRLLIAFAVVVWIGAVVYPDPRPFVSSVARLKQPPVDAQAVSAVAADLPDDYVAIEEFSAEYVTFKPAWTVYGLPWYFPTVAEVLRDRAGDCQAEAVLMASILEAKGMSYTLRYSFDHVWVDYPGKNATDLEDAATSFVSDSGKGWLASLPDRIPLRSIVEQRVAYHWTPMPLLQKTIVLLGVLLIIGYGERRLLGTLKRALWPGRDPVVSSGSS